jgi:hypothetical protein
LNYFYFEQRGGAVECRTNHASGAEKATEPTFGGISRWTMKSGYESQYQLCLCAEFHIEMDKIQNGINSIRDGKESRTGLEFCEWKWFESL